MVGKLYGRKANGMNLELEQAIRDFRKPRGRVKEKANWATHNETPRKFVKELSLAVERGALKMGKEYRIMDIMNAIRLEDQQGGYSMILLQMDLAIWRSPLKIVEMEPGRQGTYVITWRY